MLPWLPPTPILFPAPDTALDDPGGLLAAGGALTPDWLLTAYQQGIFPWYSDGQPILWWSPDPRMVLFPEELKISRSLAKRLRNGGFRITIDRAFTQVIAACAVTRASHEGTWITTEISQAYIDLHALGHAHSIEVWRDGDLVGGLYGVARGRVFFGESMFSLERDASKVALVVLAQRLEASGGGLIDCQMHTPHLASLGARDIARNTFLSYLEQYTRLEKPRWNSHSAFHPLTGGDCE